MGRDEEAFKVGMRETTVQIFKEFLTRMAKLEELWSVGNRLLIGFQQGLEFLRRPSIDRKSELIDSIIKANETERLKSYMDAGCTSNHDSIQNISKTSYQNVSLLRNEDFCATNLDQQTTVNEEETPLPDPQELEMTDTAALMGIIYSMLEQDFVMQEKIAASLNLKSMPGELESYCLMWSLRPFIDDELMQQAWRRIH